MPSDSDFTGSPEHSQYTDLDFAPTGRHYIDINRARSYTGFLLDYGGAITTPTGVVYDWQPSSPRLVRWYREPFYAGAFHTLGRAETLLRGVQEPRGQATRSSTCPDTDMIVNSNSNVREQPQRLHEATIIYNPSVFRRTHIYELPLGTDNDDDEQPQAVDSASAVPKDRTITTYLRSGSTSDAPIEHTNTRTSPSTQEDNLWHGTSTCTCRHQRALHGTAATDTAGRRYETTTSRRNSPQRNLLLLDIGAQFEVEFDLCLDEQDTPSGPLERRHTTL